MNPATRSDLIGGIAGFLCLLHCLATPLFFAVHAGSIVTGEAHPWWWGILDFIFLLISFFAVYWSVRNTSKQWVKSAFWILWVFLALIIVNEKSAFLHVPEETIYVPTLGLIALHFYNHRYCRCVNEECHIETES